MGVDVDGLGVLLLVVLVDAEDPAVAVLVLQDVRVLLALQPRVLQVEQDRLVHLPRQQPLHLLGGLQLPEVQVARRRAQNLVLVRLPQRILKLVDWLDFCGLIRNYLISFINLI